MKLFGIKPQFLAQDHVQQAGGGDGYLRSEKTEGRAVPSILVLLKTCPKSDGIFQCTINHMIACVLLEARRCLDVEKGV